MMKSVSSSWQSLWAIRVPLPVVLVLMFLAHEASFLRSSSLIKLVAAPVMQPSPVIAPVSMMQSQIAPVTIAPQAVKPKAKLQIDPARIVVAKVLLGSLSDMYEIGEQGSEKQKKKKKKRNVCLLFHLSPKVFKYCVIMRKSTDIRFT
jgi:hypothetical protein